jgi:hypothetical protein
LFSLVFRFVRRSGSPFFSLEEEGYRGGRERMVAFFSTGKRRKRREGREREEPEGKKAAARGETRWKQHKKKRNEK